jgi:hypothetical protein
MFGKSTTSIQYGRTKCVNFQSETFHIQMEVPKSISLAEANRLARFLVNAKLEKNWEHSEAIKFNDLYQELFKEGIYAFLEGIK